MLCTGLNALHELFHLVLTSVITLLLWMCKLRLEELSKLPKATTLLGSGTACF